MSIRSRVVSLDDVSGELDLTLKKLELEAAQGTVPIDEQIDFVRDLSRAAYQKEIRPWRSHGIQALLFGLACLVAGGVLPPTVLPTAIGRPLTLALMAASVLVWGACLGVYFRKKHQEEQWLRQQELHISSGHPLLDP